MTKRKGNWRFLEEENILSSGQAGAYEFPVHACRENQPLDTMGTSSVEDTACTDNEDCSIPAGTALTAAATVKALQEKTMAPAPAVRPQGSLTRTGTDISLYIKLPRPRKPVLKAPLRMWKMTTGSCPQWNGNDGDIVKGTSDTSPLSIPPASSPAGSFREFEALIRRTSVESSASAGLSGCGNTDEITSIFRVLHSYE